LAERLSIDGSYGEGGGQSLRTVLALAGITGRPVRIEGIRAGRRSPGLAAQHLTAIRAVAAVCGAATAGAVLGSQSLDFTPAGPPRPGDYRFDVAEARTGGSAGSVTLVLQAVLPVLAFARGASRVIILGGTHVAWSPPFDYAREVWLPALARHGIAAELDIARTGWYPAGGGEVRATVAGGMSAGGLAPVNLRERGALSAVHGRAVAASLPSHIAQRMADRARVLLDAAGVAGRIGAERVTATCPGAGLFLTAEYDGVRAGFSALGERGKPAERVAEEAVEALLAHRRSGAACDEHLADQLVLPAALAAGASHYSAERASRHLTTCAWVVERFGLARVAIEDGADRVAHITVAPERGGTPA